MQFHISYHTPSQKIPHISRARAEINLFGQTESSETEIQGMKKTCLSRNPPACNENPGKGETILSPSLISFFYLKKESLQLKMANYGA
jgi:hypothetical protein